MVDAHPHSFPLESVTETKVKIDGIQSETDGLKVAFNHFTVNADLTWAFNNIFESDFKTISFGLYPIYLNLGFGYRF